MGTLIFKNGKYRFHAVTQNEIKQARFWGLQEDADTLQWVTRNPGKALGLRRFADLSAERKFKKTFITDLAPPESIPFPDSLMPKTFQLESAWHALTRTPSFIADQAGLGKTITSCLCMNATPGKTLIICPPFLKYNWASEIEKWVDGWHRQIKGVLVSIIEDGKALARDPSWDADVVILPDSLISKKLARTMVAERSWRWLFVDEVHRYKEADTQRTKALLGEEDEPGVTDFAERVVLLSGTPIPNGRPIELWPILTSLAPEAIAHRSLQEFGKEFCAGKRITRFEGKRAVVNWDFRGHSNLKKLREELRSKFMIRHLKHDVLKELGPKTRKIVFLDEAGKLKPLEAAVLANHSLEDLMGEKSELGDIARYRREVGEAKLEPAAEYISDLLEGSNDKLVVFAHHIDVVEGLKRELKRFHPLSIRGGMTGKEKALRASHFQKNEKHRVIIGNMDAMGVGLTLTQAPGCVVVEPSWVPGINEQAEDRVHRMTQKENVYVRYLVLRNSLDERVLRSVLGKQQAITRVMD